MASRMLGSWRISESPDLAEIYRYAKLLDSYLKIFVLCRDTGISIVDKCDVICSNCRFRRIMLVFAPRMPKSALVSFNSAGLNNISLVFPVVIEIVIGKIEKREVLCRLKSFESETERSKIAKDSSEVSSKVKIFTPDTTVSVIPPIIKNQTNLVAQLNQVFCHYCKDSSLNDYISNTKNNTESKPTSFLLLPPNMSKSLTSIDNFSGVFYLTVLYKYLEKDFGRKDTVTWRGFKFNNSIDLGPTTYLTNNTKIDMWVFLNNWQTYKEIL